MKMFQKTIPELLKELISEVRNSNTGQITPATTADGKMMVEIDYLDILNKQAQQITLLTNILEELQLNKTLSTKVVDDNGNVVNEFYQNVLFNSTISTSANIVVGGTAQTISPASERRAFELQNTSNSDLYLSFGSNASLTNGFKISSNSTYHSPANCCSHDFISIFGQTTGQSFQYIIYG